MDNENENPDSINENAEATAGETAEQRASRLAETNKKLYERTKKSEEDARAWREYQRTLKEKSAISDATAKPSDFKPSDILKADEFKLYRMGYLESEIDLIMHNGGAKILEDTKNPLVMGLQAAKEQRSAEDAAGRVSDSSGLSDIERKYTEQDMRNMTKEELAKLLPHVSK